ncbi:MAG: glucans biosynthesis glucosyltransferase MdoH [Betaproteobacteria bacterium]|nr:glucans biosynthesis glucosyltransferase MdoH [Betaproteobacteria bacterium]
MNPFDLISLNRSATLAPPIRRGSMVSQPWIGFVNSLKAWLQGKRLSPPELHESAPWERAASRRRITLITLICLTAGSATLLLARTQPVWDHPVLRLTQLLLFMVLFAWVAAGFFTALMGFWVQLRPDRFALSLAQARALELGEDARTAIIMPICNENVATVFAGLRATCESLAASSNPHLFDVYVLSDTNDPSIRAHEQAAWSMLSDALSTHCAVYYRWRQRRTRRKAGNVADFCRRWGRNYRYMVVLDADSVMSGESLTTLVRLMEIHPKAGIIQTAPQTCGLDTLHARAQQFAGRVTGRLFTAGMQYWQLGESHYWGHNAIIRIAPFMKHCALSPLPGRGGLSGDILSHDFVEAALMRRAGFHTWLVPTLEGSYEQQPPNLIEELQRDRRWCQGNLKNIRLIAEPGFQAVHRVMLATGVMAYLSAPLWLGFILISLALRLLNPPAATATLNPLAGSPSTLIALWMVILALLFLPRILAVVAILWQQKQRSYGGTAQLIKGTLLETGLSVLQAPIRMMAHTLFVLTALTGIDLDWKSPPREAETLQWNDAAQRFLPLVSSMMVLLLTTFLTEHSAAWWLLPVGLPLLLAIPLSVLTSKSSLGRRLRALRLLVTPEERHAPAVLQRARSYSVPPLSEWTPPIAPLAPWRSLYRDNRVYSGVS